jgi:molybdopterin converting factor subunit 1
MHNGVKLLAFAGTRDIVGASEVDLALSGPCSVEDLFRELCRLYPALEPHRRSLRIAVNGTYATPDEQVSLGDEVALIPPVAGG